MNKVDGIRQSNRANRAAQDGLAMVADGGSLLAWVTVEPKPADYFAELFGGCQMYGNKILQQYKEKYVHILEGIG